MSKNLMCNQLPTTLDQWPEMVGRSFTGDWFAIDPQRQQDFYTGTYLDQSYGPTIGDFYPEGIVEGFQQLGLLDYLVVEPRGEGYRVSYEITMDVENADKPCMIAHWIVLLLPLDQ